MNCIQRKWISRYLLPVLLCLMSQVAVGRVLLVTHQDIESHAALGERLAERIEDAESVPVERLQQQALSRADLIITIGFDAFRKSLELQPQSMLLAVYLTRNAYHSILAKYPQDPDRVSAIYFEHPYSRQAALIRALLPGSKTIGAVLGPLAQSDRPKLIEALERYDFTPWLIDIDDPEDEPADKLQRLFSSVDAVLAVPDSGLLNRTLAKWSLELSFRRRIPVIGYSAKYASAGAVAALVTSGEQLLEQILTSCGCAFDTARSDFVLPAPAYTQDYRVELNQRVLRSMGLRGVSEQQLKENIQALESVR